MLETERAIALPAPRPHSQRPRAPRPAASMPPCPRLLTCRPKRATSKALRLVVDEDETQGRIWNTLLAEEHPQGTTIFVGCQKLAFIMRVSE